MVGLRELNLAVLKSIACDDILRTTMALRGSTAMWMFHSGQREGDDLDFVCLNIPRERRTLSEMGRAMMTLNEALNRWLPIHFPGYREHQAQVHAALRIELGADDSTVTQWQPVGIYEGRNLNIRVATPEDAVAEKMVAILQPLRPDRLREQDLFDLATLTPDFLKSLNYRVIHTQANLKIVPQRGVPYAISSYGPQLRERLLSPYSLFLQKRHCSEPDFNTAWHKLLDLVQVTINA